MHSHLQIYGELSSLIEFAAEYHVIFMIAFCGIATYNLYLTVRALVHWRRGDKLNAAYYGYNAVGYLWPTGLLAKILVLGPEFLRWYVADIGFVLVLPALAILEQAVPPRSSYANEPLSAIYRRTLDKLGLTRTVVKVAFIGVVCYELLMGLIYWRYPDINVQDVGSTDPIDILMYTIGLIVGLKLLKTIEAPYTRQLKLAEETEREAPRTVKAAVRKPKRSTTKRKHHNPHRK